ncbi:YfiR family protein [Aeromonas finlandensis]|uniref:YfiR family protein n=1 Tax=Aeromonas finlandensis TaxID=1543375 RepID=UPI00051B2299|nr:YfiR family protein [Aeromonas finlandensis]
MLLLFSPRFTARLALLLVAFGLLLPRAQAETAAESRATAVRELVLDLLSYTRWPKEPPILRMCVVAPTEYAGALFTINRQANGRTVQVNRYETSDPAIAGNCDVLYLGMVSEQTRVSLFTRLQGHAILSISEHNQECSSSAVFCLQTSLESVRVRFKVNLDALALSGVRVHPAVLKLGHADKREAP